MISAKKGKTAREKLWSSERKERSRYLKKKVTGAKMNRSIGHELWLGRAEKPLAKRHKETTNAAKQNLRRLLYVC